MNILIIKNGKCKTLINKILKSIDKNININIIYNSQLEKINILPDKVIILGGLLSVNDNNKNINIVLNFIKKCDENNIPILGICLGCQLIAKYLGCEIKKAKRSIIGFKKIKVINTENNLSNILKKYDKYFISLHNDYIIPNDKINIYAYYNNFPYLINYKNMIGLQFHPDIIEDNYSKFLNYFKLTDNKKKKIKYLL